MKKLLIVGLIVVLFVLALSGCSDDTDCPTCPQFTQEGIALFYAYVYDNELNCFGMMYGLDGNFISLDSVIVDTFKMEIEQSFGEGMATYCSLEDGGFMGASKSPIDFSSAAASGDTVDLKIYTPNGVTESSVAVLDDQNDIPVIYNWPVDYPYDTVAQSTEITVAWAPVANAEYYAVDWRFYHNHDGVPQNLDTTIAVSTDTSFVIPASLLGYDGRIYIDVYAINGPDLTDSGNLTGGVLKGRFNSITGEYFRIYIGTGDPYPPTTIDLSEKEIIHKSFKDLLF